MPGSFLDTNVLVYLASGDLVKADRAEELVAHGGSVSVQVLNEFANVARRKMGLPWPETRELLSTLRALLSVHAVTVETHERGLALAGRHDFCVFDAMIVAAALGAGSDVLWSEDMHHGMVVDQSLRILNPFVAGD